MNCVHLIIPLDRLVLKCVPRAGFDAAGVRHPVLQGVRPGDGARRHGGVVVEPVPKHH